MFWSKCLGGVFISALVAPFHVKFCTIKTPSRHCVFIVFWLCFHGVLVECFGPFFFPYGNTGEYQRRRVFIISNQGGGTKICTITSRFCKLQCGLFCHTTSHFKKLVHVERNKYKCNSSSTRCKLISFYSFFNSNINDIDIH